MSGVQADHLVAMTRGHLLSLLEQFDYQGIQPRLLCADAGDVPDPIGGDQQIYRECSQQILGHLQKLLPEVLQR